VSREDVGFDSGGLRCAAWLYRPEAEGPQPCVVMAHGFSAVRDQRLDAYAERFAAAALACLVFDYRYFGASEGEPRQLLDIRRQLEDWRAAIAYARGLEGIDPERIGLWGSSFSGGHVVATAAADPRVRAVVSQVPFTDGPSAVRLLSPRDNVRLMFAGVRDQVRGWLGRPPLYVPAVGPPGTFASMTAPEAEPGFAAMTPPRSTWVNQFTPRVMLRVGLYRPYSKLASVQAPVLVITADKDATTPSTPAVRAAEQAPNAELLRLPLGHFDPYVGELFEETVAAQTDFLTRQLLGAREPVAK
jgi:fermentation-respiration switch protein FrsA (DUF1100 family)